MKFKIQKKYVNFYGFVSFIKNWTSLNAHRENIVRYFTCFSLWEFLLKNDSKRICEK